MNSIRSFTEHALYNKYALNVLCPSNCEIKEIEQNGNSVLDAIDQARTDVFNNPLKTSLLHKCTKPVRFVARMVYTMAVTVLISPLGAAFNGTRSLYYLTKWTFCKAAGWEGAKLEAKAKTMEVGKYFFLDLGSFVYGLVVNAVLFYGAGACVGYPITSKVISAALIVGTVTYLTEAYAPDSFLPRFLTDDENRAGMYISLALRNRLGICGKGGSLLKFGMGDAIVKKYLGDERYNFEGAGLTKLINLVVQAEFKLLDDVREAKALLSIKNIPLEFTYPFDGNAVAAKVSEAFKETIQPHQAASSNAMGSYDSDSAKIKELIHRLKVQQVKVSLLSEIYHKALSICLEESPQLAAIALMFGGRVPTYEINQVKVFINQDYYVQWFDIPFTSEPASPGASAPQGNCPFSRLNVQLDGWDPSTTSKNDEENLYVRFNRKVRENVWKLKNNQQTDSLFSLVDLTDEFSHAESKKAYREYALALHPDKVKTDESVELFKVLGAVKDAMDAELKSRG
jgi:hypothetical protein